MVKENRIRKNEEFSRIISKRKSCANSSFVVYFDKRAQDHSRIGISVSKKLGNAVVRNKIKRQVRMMIANFYKFDEETHDFIIIVRNSFLENSFAENQLNLEKLIRKSYNR
ncbi:MAG: ribonuclease P protein component [Erysipelotrichaceae bacterium]|nr:ribonuclease P protein component [Erysipelotrichaceae bacterium]